MTDIEQKARALLVEVRKDLGAHPMPEEPFARNCISHEALYRAIEKHEAYKQEVSDVMLFIATTYPMPAVDFSRFIIPAPKPDPLINVAKMLGYYNTAAKHLAGDIRSALGDIRSALYAAGLGMGEKNDD